MGWGVPHAAEILFMLQNESVPVEAYCMVLESACHWLVIAPRLARAHRLRLAGVCAKTGRLIFRTKAGFGIAKVLLVENDIDISDVEEVVWAFASRTHPSHGEFYFGQDAQIALPVFLDSNEKFAYRTTKVIHNALLADRFPPDRRPKRSDFAHGWPAPIREEVIS